MKSSNTLPEITTRLMSYRLAVALVDHLEEESLLSSGDKQTMLQALNQKYGFEAYSVLAEGTCYPSASE